MSDDQSADAGAPEPPARTSDGQTQELPAVSADQSPVSEGTNHVEQVRQEEFPIDEEMLAAFLGESQAPAPASAADEAVTEPEVVEHEVVEEVASEVMAEPEAVEPEVVADVTAEDTTAESSDEAPVTTAGPVSHAAPRRSAWSTVLTVIGIVLIVIAVGAAGVYIGRLTAPASSVVVQSETVVEAEEVSAPMAVGPRPVPAPGTILITTSRVPNATWPVVLTGAEVLDDSAGTAPGYRLVNSGISGAQVASILATTFGAAGDVIENAAGWTVGADAEPRVVVVNDPLFSWTFTDQAAIDLPDDGATALDPAVAISQATAVLQGIGVDISTVEYELQTDGGRTAVQAWQVVDERRTQLGWRLVIGSDGQVLEASGFSSGLEAVPDYPIVGAASAVTRSQQSPWSSLPASPITGPLESATTPSPRPSASGVPQVDLAMTTVAVVSADLGLAQYWQPDGSILLLPSWILTGADGSTWSLLAVAEPAVAFVDQPFPIDAEAPGFVAGAFPADDVLEIEGLPGDTVVGEVLPGEDAAASNEASATGSSEAAQDDVADEGGVEQDGNVLFLPSADPAAAQ